MRGHSSARYYHPINSLVGRKFVPIAEEKNKRTVDKKVSWRIESIVREQSAIGMLPLFSEKSQKTSGAGTFTFYPLQLTLLNISESSRGGQITSGRTV